VRRLVRRATENRRNSSLERSSNFESNRGESRASVPALRKIRGNAMRRWRVAISAAMIALPTEAAERPGPCFCATRSTCGHQLLNKLLHLKRQPLKSPSPLHLQHDPMRCSTCAELIARKVASQFAVMTAHPQRRAFSLSSMRFNSSSFCPASPSLPSAVRRW